MMLLKLFEHTYSTFTMVQSVVTKTGRAYATSPTRSLQRMMLSCNSVARLQAGFSMRP